MGDVVVIDDDDVPPDPSIDWYNIYIPAYLDEAAYNEFIAMLKEKLPWQELDLPDPNTQPLSLIHI